MARHHTAFVWVWLPDATEPVVAGRLDIENPDEANRDRQVFGFTYGQTYLGQATGYPLYLPELPLQAGQQRPLVGQMAGCISDAGPDSWGRRVIENAQAGDEPTDPGPLDYLLGSGSDRIGALDFQLSASTYVARATTGATLAELAESAERVEQGVPLSPELDMALLHGSSVGGARPKALLTDGPRHLIAKFTSSTDTYPQVRAEFVAMELARRAGVNATTVDIATAGDRDVLLVDRFDRPPAGGRRAMVSALTILGLDEWGARYATYADLADQVRARFTEPEATLRELFARVTFNILVSNTDDHARNHAAFWDGQWLSLTPAYDICPQPRTGQETEQAMALGHDGYRLSNLAGAAGHSGTYLLSTAEAREIIDRQVQVIRSDWNEVCDLARMSDVERSNLWERQFLNPYAFYDY